MSIKYTLKDLQSYAKDKGGECLSKDYTNDKRRYQWKCAEEDHPIFQKQWVGMHTRNAWCLKCKRYNLKYSINDLHEYAKTQNGKCISTKYEQCRSSYLWVCEENHEFTLAWSGIVQSNMISWCSICAGRKCVIKQLKDHAEEKNGQCLSNEYITNMTRYDWMCEKEHIFKRSWHAVKNESSWCQINKN
jgi:hypothetical protein